MPAERVIGFTGDVMLGRLVDERQQTRAVDAVWGDVGDRLRAFDGLFVNLECCLSTRGEPWTKTYHPYHFRADPDWAVPALERAGVDCATLANNHLKDFGDVALVDTLDALDDAGIARTGAGRDLDEALDPAVVDCDGLRVAVVAFTDNVREWAAGPDEPGVAHVDVDPDDETTRERVATALSRAEDADPDLVVASLHWGPNMTREPPAAHPGFARWLVDRGVDVVWGHSAHVFHGVEVVDGAPVLYDAGDFVDDYAVDDELRNDRGFAFALVVRDGRPRGLRLRPTEIRDCAVHEATGDVAAWCRERMREKSAAYGTTFERDGVELVASFE